MWIRKRLGFLVLMLALAVGVPMLNPGKAFADTNSDYVGGLLDGKVMKNTLLNEPQPYITDNDRMTQNVINSNAGDIWYEFTDPVEVNAYIIRQTANGTLLRFYDSNGTKIHEVTTTDTTSPVKRTISTVTGVKKVAIFYPQATGTNGIFELEVFGQMVDDTPPPTPTGLTATAGDGQVTLNWNAVSATDLNGYNVYRNGSKVNISPLSATSSLVVGLTNGVEYSFQVTAVDMAGNESPKSPAVTATPQAPPDNTPPSPPTGVTATPDNAQVTITWNANPEPDVKGYKVYRDGVEIRYVTTAQTRTVTDTGLTNGTTYTYYVTAIDQSDNESAPSASVQATPDDEMAVSLTPNGTSIIVAITGGQAPYTIKWGDGPDQSTTTSQKTYYITGLEKSTDYTVTVTDNVGQVFSQTINTGATTGYLPPRMPDSTSLFQNMVNMFGRAGTIALYVIGGAVALGLLVILALWAWRLLKKWLASSK